MPGRFRILRSDLLPNGERLSPALQCRRIVSGVHECVSKLIVAKPDVAARALIVGIFS